MSLSKKYIILIFFFLAFLPTDLFADGFIVKPKWSKEKINEPQQRAIIVYDNYHEDLILQVKVEGAPKEFGLVIPIPSKPEVYDIKGDVFFELEKYLYELQLERWKEWKEKKKGFLEMFTGTREQSSSEPPVTVESIKQVGAFEVATLSATDAQALVEWISHNGFVLPEGASNILQNYVEQKFYYIAARCNMPEKIKDGYLPSLGIRFPSRWIFYPLYISRLNQNVTKVKLQVLLKKTEDYYSPRFPFIIWDEDFDVQNEIIKGEEIKEKIPHLANNIPILGQGEWHVFTRQREFLPSEMIADICVPAHFMGDKGFLGDIFWRPEAIMFGLYNDLMQGPASIRDLSRDKLKYYADKWGEWWPFFRASEVINMLNGLGIGKEKIDLAAKEYPYDEGIIWEQLEGQPGQELRGLALEMQESKSKYKMNESAKFRLTLKNISQNPVQLELRDGGWYLEIYNEDGQNLFQEGDFRSDKISTVTIQPGEHRTKEVELTLAPFKQYNNYQEKRFNEKGSYYIVGVVRAPGKTQSPNLLNGIWKTYPLRIEVED